MCLVRPADGARGVASVRLLGGYGDLDRTQAIFPSDPRRAIAQDGVHKVDDFGQVSIPKASQEVILQLVAALARLEEGGGVLPQGPMKIDPFEPTISVRTS